MRLTSIILLTCCVHVAAKTSSQTVTYKGSNVPLEKIFMVVEQQTGYLFIYNPSLLEEAKPVSVSAEEMPIDHFLQKVLTNQQLEFEFNDRTIIIKRKPVTADLSARLRKENLLPISGVVKGVDGKPLANVSVVVKGSSKGTRTDDNGHFTIDVREGDVLIISSVGFGTKEMEVSSGNRNLSVSLLISSSRLDEVQVIPYGTQIKRFSTGSVSTVKAGDIEKQPVSNPLLALQGRIPGMVIIQNSGVPGGGISVHIRGQNSIGSGNDPLYVIDGIPYLSQMLPNLAGDILLGGNPLNFINPSDIESISVLKDADATAIYGSRGGNGVVLITTKQGRIGKTKLDVDVSKGIGKVARKLDLLDTKQYLQMRREAFQNDGESPTLGNAPDLLFWDTTRYTDWQRLMIGGTANYNNVQASLSGGTANTQCLIGANYHKETTVFPGDYSDQKGSLHLSIKNVSLNEKFTSNFSGSYLTDYNNLLVSDLAPYIILSPDAPEVFNSDGSLNWANSTWPVGNPLALTKKLYRAHTNNIVGNLNLNYELAKGLTIKGSFGYTNMQVNEISTSPLASLDPAYNLKGSASFTNNFSRSWNIEPQLSYLKTTGLNTINVLIGGTFQQNTSDGSIIEGSGYNSDAMIENIQAAPVVKIRSVTNTLYKYNAAFARINYTWNENFIINLTGRRDGSSRFGDNNKFHNFGSVGAAWLFGTEKFIRQSLPFVSFGKIRGSAGTTGNDQIGDYSFYDLYSTGYFPYQGTVALTPIRLYNPNLEWEETKKIEGGIEVGLLKDRVGLEASFYRNRSSNQLLSFVLPGITGFTSYSTNLPATVQNYGWEIVLNTTNVQTHNFNWKSSFNVTIAKNKLVEFPEIEKTFYKYFLSIGKPVTISKVFDLIGVNDTTGTYEFVDNKGTILSSPTYGDDQTAISNTTPEYYGGLNNSLVFKNFEFDFLFQFVKQTGKAYLPFAPPGIMNNLTNDIFVNRWQKPGDNSSVQRLTQSFISPAASIYNYVLQSNYSYTDASFIRLKNVSMSYQLSKALLRRLQLQNGKIYIQGQNLLTITRYKGVDPENSGYRAIPPLRVITMGIKLSF
jgi:TonB-dependent starch-binding outer membrane protein SusC